MYSNMYSKVLYRKCCAVQCCKRNAVQETLYRKMLHSKILYSETLYSRNGPTVGALNAESPKITFSNISKKVSWSRNRCFSCGFALYFACAKL